jgi:hypothetical protein
MRHDRRVARAVALVSFALGTSVACHSSSTASSTTGPVARFKLSATDAPPDYLDVPFPSDAYVQNGKVVSDLPGLSAVIPNSVSFITYGLSQNDGFSRIALAAFAVDDTSAPPAADGTPAAAKIDPATLPVSETDCTADTSSVFLLDLAAADPTKARVPCRAGVHDDRPKSTTTPVIAVGPARGVVLDEGHEYAAVLTSAVKDTSGRALQPSADMKAVAAGTATGAVGQMYAQAYAKAAALLPKGASIVSIAPYRTMARTHELFAMRDVLEKTLAPTLSWDASTLAPMGAAKFAAVAPGASLPAGFTASLDDWLGVTTQKLPSGVDDPSLDQPVRAHDQIAAAGTAVFESTSYMQTAPTEYSDPSHHTFVYDGAGNPVPQGSAKIWVSFAIPKAPMPASGYPAIILQHGLNGSRLYLMDLANVLCAKGWIVAAIDSVTFGARAAESKYQVDQINVWQDAPGAKYKGPDGFADPVDGGGTPTPKGSTNGSFDFFGGLQSIAAIRDQFRQAGFDTAQLAQVLRASPDLAPLATGGVTPKIDGSHVGYIGDSLGAMEGTIAAAIEPTLNAWVLNVDGGGIFPELSAHSPTIGLQVVEAATINFGLIGDTYSFTHPLLQLLQNIIEPGDPLVYAPYLVKSPQPLAGKPTSARNVLQIQALYDEIVPNEANEALARAGGWGIATPNVGSNAEVWDLKGVATNPRKTPLPDVAPDSAGAVHDTPSPGATAVMVQCSPCTHGSDIVTRAPSHNFQIPFFDPTGAPDYTAVGTPFSYAEPMDATQAMFTTFLDDALKGNVPRVMGYATPVRDYDGDGTPDDQDAFPYDPTRH